MTVAFFPNKQLRIIHCLRNTEYATTVNHIITSTENKMETIYRLLMFSRFMYIWNVTVRINDNLERFGASYFPGPHYNVGAWHLKTTRPTRSLLPRTCKMWNGIPAWRVSYVLWHGVLWKPKRQWSERLASYAVTLKLLMSMTDDNDFFVTWRKCAGSVRSSVFQTSCISDKWAAHVAFWSTNREPNRVALWCGWHRANRPGSLSVSPCVAWRRLLSTSWGAVRLWPRLIFCTDVPQPVPLPPFPTEEYPHGRMRQLWRRPGTF